MNVVRPVTTNATWSWNGPVCPTCHRGYVGQHTCSPDDLRRLVDDLCRRINELERRAPQADTYASRCSCNPLNGGSGVCGCVLGGTFTTC